MNKTSSRRAAWPHLNERTFTLALFALSLSIVLAKLAMHCDTNSNPVAFLGLHNKNLHFDAKKLIQSTMNASSIHYEELVNSKAVSFLKEYYWFVKALVSGVAITAFTWLIIYKDSSVPGVNPPSPFSPKKYTYFRTEPDFCMHINYLLGLVIGVLIFIYMCF